MANYKTPGVYIEEISSLPPSVGQVPTAVPAFIGYSEKAVKNGKSIISGEAFARDNKNGGSLQGMAATM